MSGTLPIDPDAVVWSVPAAERAAALTEHPLLLLLHGYGSHERDLAPLTAYLPERFVTASLRAPLPQGPGFAWFPLTTPGTPDPESLNAPARGILAWLDTLPARPSSITALGFSQGGAMSLQLLRLAPERIERAVNLSGFVAPGELPGDATLAASKPAVFWGRDVGDPIIAPVAIERTEAWLPAHATATVRLYPGIQHSISRAELDDVAAFLGE